MTSNLPAAGASTVSAVTAESVSASASGAPAAAPQQVQGKVMLGMYTDLPYLNQTNSFVRRQSQLGRNLRIQHWYYTWWDTFLWQGAPAQGVIPMLSWPMPGSFASVVNGSQDSVILAHARTLRNYGRPVFLRLGWEMNGNWFPWGTADANGFIKAWRHIHDVFASQGATNVAWVWCPNYNSAPGRYKASTYYPGDGYVDWVGVDGYSVDSDGDKSPSTLFDPTVSVFGSRKPIMIAETSAGESPGRPDRKANWIRAFQAWVKATPSVGAVVWFDTNKDGGRYDSRVDTSNNSWGAFWNLAHDGRFYG